MTRQGKQRPVGRWQLQEAKARLSELVQKATREGPQEITVRGEPTAVVLSRADYERLHHKPKWTNLSDFLLNSPLAGLDIEFERDRSLTRNARLFDDDQ